MNIRLAEENDFKKLAEIKWEHCAEDDIVYGESNLKGCDKNNFITEFVEFLKTDTSYKIFIAEKDREIVSSMYLSLIPKLPKPNGNSKYIGYLTNVFTKKEFRNNGVGT